MVRKKAEGIEALVSKEEPISIQEITMLDWYAAFALIGVDRKPHDSLIASSVFNLAEAMMNERKNRL